MSTRTLTLTALLTALLCILGPATLPLGPIPLSLVTALLMGMALLLGGRRALLCCGIYLLMGLTGLPVFSGFTGGIGAILGPSGGFLLGYLPMTLLSGIIFQRTENRVYHALGCIGATALLYLTGTAWYCWQAGTSAAAGLAVCVLPFLPGDAIKIAAVLTAGQSIKRRLKKAGLV